jgi:hypothetical protein
MSSILLSKKIILPQYLHDEYGNPLPYIAGAFFKEIPESTVVDHLINVGSKFTNTPSRYLPIKWPDLKNLF